MHLREVSSRASLSRAGQRLDSEQFRSAPRISRPPYGRLMVPENRAHGQALKAKPLVPYFDAGAETISNSSSAFIAASKRPAGSRVLFHSMTFGNHLSATV